MQENIWNDKNLIKILQEDGVVIMPTDTIYGMVGRAQAEFVVNRIYTIRKRNPTKPCIILIGDTSELEKFSVILTQEQKNKLKELWHISVMADMCHERAVSIVLDCPDPALEYLHRGTNTLAFRLPAPQALRDLLLETGPLIAPSANLETIPPCETMEDARKYFGYSVDLYIDGGTIKNKASKLIKLHKDGSIDLMRN
ncbi:L-threonylcarbamoyladenylate synthase [Candidatus Nomurabacteria bacterium]|nr:L-threonylcarbamoyladenylate synthase [Candidatus Nomurabacteria bacterium]